MRVFLDANVLFSAANAGSNISRLIARLAVGHAVVTSDFALDESRRNIALKRPAWQAEFERLVAGLEVVHTSLFELPIELDDKDRPILCAAIGARCDLLASGDRRHFGPYYDRTVLGVTIVSVAGLAERLCTGST